MMLNSLVMDGSQSMAGRRHRVQVDDRQK